VVNREPGAGEMHDDIATILCSSFDAAKRKLRKIVEQQRGGTKEHQQ
jgi:hypothetical protein